jgi:hypothetical protein
MMQDASNNKRRWERIGGLFVVTLAIVLAGCSSQGDKASNTTTPTPSPTPATAAASPTASGTPSTTSLMEAAMTWGHIEEARAQLDKAVESNNFSEAHDAAVKIRDSVNALPGKSAALATDKRDTLNSQVKEVDRLAAKLGEAGHANNAEAMHENHKALNAALDQVKGLYPPGTEMMDKGMERMEMGKEMMNKGKNTMDKDTMDKGMGMMDEGMDMMEMGKDMVGNDMDMDMMDKGMDMMGKGKGMAKKGKDSMDKGMMEKGMHMMENGIHMMDNAKEMMKKGGMKKGGMKNDKMKKDKMGMKDM